MSDTKVISNAVGNFRAATDEVAYSGESVADVQLVRVVGVTGAEGSKTVVPAHDDPALLLHDNHDFSTTQTSAILYTPTSGKKLALTGLRISTGGTTAAVLTIYFGSGAYSAGTSKTAYRGEFAPSATLRERAIMDFSRPLIGADNDSLRITTSAGLTCYIQWEGFEVE